MQYSIWKQHFSVSLWTLSGRNTKTASAADEIGADARAAAPGVDLS